MHFFLISIFFGLISCGQQVKGKSYPISDGGKIELRAQRKLFDMFIELQASDIEGKILSIHFSDRFGPTTLKMSSLN